MYFAVFLATTILMVWTVPWLVGEFEKTKEVAPVSFSPNVVAVATIGAGVFFTALAFLVFLVTRTFVPSQQGKELVDAFLLNVHHRQDFAMICAYATMAAGVVLRIKAAFIK